MAGVFVLKDAKSLLQMKPATFADEDAFQTMLANFPDLLAGDEIDPAAPRRWMLISREASIPSEENGINRWSADHLFIDQDGIPTIVEVKRKTDTRLRREVVGQMLEYAANATVFWSAEQLRQSFETHCEKQKTDPVEHIKLRLGENIDVEQLWQQLKTNLRAGQIRLIFVADRIPLELRRIVEFLNEQMESAEVLALELQQFEGENLRTIVPVLFGQSQEALRKKSVGAPRTWTESDIYSDMEKRVGADAVDVAMKIAEWIKLHSRLWFGQGRKDGSMRASFTVEGREFSPFRVWTNGKLEIAFGPMKEIFKGNEEVRNHLFAMLQAIPGVKFDSNAVEKYPTIPLLLFKGEKEFSKLREALDWFASRAK